MRQNRKERRIIFNCKEAVLVQSQSMFSWTGIKYYSVIVVVQFAYIVWVCLVLKSEDC